MRLAYIKNFCFLLVASVFIIFPLLTSAQTYESCIASGQSEENCIQMYGLPSGSGSSGSGGGYTGGTTNSGGSSSGGYTGGSNNGTGGSNTGVFRCEGDFEIVAGTCVPKSPSTTGFLKAKTLGELVKMVINALLSLAGIVAVIYIIIGGYWYITAGGNDEQAEKGRKALTNAVIGLVLIILSYVIVNVVVRAITSDKILG